MMKSPFSKEFTDVISDILEREPPVSEEFDNIVEAIRVAPVGYAPKDVAKGSVAPSVRNNLAKAARQGRKEGRSLAKQEVSSGYRNPRTASSATAGSRLTTALNMQDKSKKYAVSLHKEEKEISELTMQPKIPLSGNTAHKPQPSHSPWKRPDRPEIGPPKKLTYDEKHKTLSKERTESFIQSLVDSNLFSEEEIFNIVESGNGSVKLVKGSFYTDRLDAAKAKPNQFVLHSQEPDENKTGYTTKHIGNFDSIEDANAAASKLPAGHGHQIHSNNGVGWVKHAEAKPKLRRPAPIHNWREGPRPWGGSKGL